MTTEDCTCQNENCEKQHPGNAYLTLPRRLREAADVLEELSALAGYQHLGFVAWSADSLRTEADMLEVE